LIKNDENQELLNIWKTPGSMSCGYHLQILNFFSVPLYIMHNVSTLYGVKNASFHIAPTEHL